MASSAGDTKVGVVRNVNAARAAVGKLITRDRPGDAAEAGGEGAGRADHADDPSSPSEEGLIGSERAWSSRRQPGLSAAGGSIPIA